MMPTSPSCDITQLAFACSSLSSFYITILPSDILRYAAGDIVTLDIRERAGPYVLIPRLLPARYTPEVIIRAYIIARHAMIYGCYATTLRTVAMYTRQLFRAFCFAFQPLSPVQRHCRSPTRAQRECWRECELHAEKDPLPSHTKRHEYVLHGRHTARHRHKSVLSEVTRTALFSPQE